MDDPNELWQKFQAGDKSARNDLVVHYLPLVDRVLKGMKGNSSSSYTQKQDQQSDGAIGLMDAVDKFDPSRGVPFGGYAVLRIRGAVLDGMRANDPVPRSLRSKKSRLDHSIEVLSQKNGRTPTGEELADHSGLDLDEVSELSRPGVESTVSYGEYDQGREEGFGHQIPFSIPGADLDLDHLRDTIATSFRSMEDRERVLFALHYGQDLSFSDIGTVLGITEARVGQIHLRAIRDLYSRVSA